MDNTDWQTGADEFVGGDKDWPALPNDREPTGDAHEVGVNELFFSTTDAKGLITEANSVFVRLSRFSRDRLIGAPHNIIRHPVMPQGAFKLMWDTLEAGEPFCAYVDNLAADESTYSVFATITPIPDGYLSVRSRPMVTGLYDAAKSLYDIARPFEHQARSEGHGSRSAAGIGLGKLAEALAEAGFPNYDEFIWLALPAEVETRQRNAAPLSAREDVIGPLGTMLGATADLAAELRSWSGRQTDLERVAKSLGENAPKLSQAMVDANETATEIETIAASNPALAPILLSVTLWAAMMGEIETQVRELLGNLEELRTSSARTRFRVALARLHTDAVGQFVNELIDNVDPDMWGEDSIDMLCGALTEGFNVTAQHSAENAQLAAQVAQNIRDAAGLLAMPRDLIANWQTMAQGRSDEAILALLPRISEQLDKTQTEGQLLEQLANECSAVATVQDTSEAERLLGLIADAVAEYAAPPPAPRRAIQG